MLLLPRTYAKLFKNIIVLYNIINLIFQNLLNSLMFHTYNIQIRYEKLLPQFSNIRCKYYFLFKQQNDDLY